MGVELAAAAELNEFWTLSGALTASQIRRKPTLGEASGYLAERPAVLANLSISRRFVNVAYIGAELEHRGRAYSLDETGAFVPLEVSTQLNLSASLPIGNGAELYINADNLTDTLVEPQIGLPAPGRSVRGGFRVSLP
jgi:iron complex outermembrane receptor protein